MASQNQVSEKELSKIVHRMGEAEKGGDENFFKMLLSDNLIFRRANGTIVNKETFLKDLQNPTNTFETLESSDIVIQIYKVIAVITLLVHAKGMRENKPFDGVFRNIRIFVQEPDKQPQWQLHAWFNVRTP